MHVAHLSLTDFRSYPTLELPLDPGVTALIGPNGQGKTNLVEAVGYLATLGSHRVAHDGPLVRQGAERAVLRASVLRERRSTLIELELTPGKANRARVNRAPVPRPREILGLLRTVLFAPEDLALVKGDPAERRRYLDELLVTRTPRMAGVRADYDRVLKQRTALLRSAGAAMRGGGGDLRTLDVWDAHLAEVGAELLGARLDLVTALDPLVRRSYRELSRDPGPAPVAMGYRSSLGEQVELTSDRHVLAAALQAAMAQRRREELERGLCLVGPHRDDVLLRLGEFPAKGYASHGESWSLALSLRLAAFELLSTESGGDQPVLVLDDVFAELDTSRRARLADLVAKAEQVLVTAAVPEDVPEALDGARVDVCAGEVRRVR